MKIHSPFARSLVVQKLSRWENSFIPPLSHQVIQFIGKTFASQLSFKKKTHLLLITINNLPKQYSYMKI